MTDTRCVVFIEAKGALNLGEDEGKRLITMLDLPPHEGPRAWFVGIGHAGNDVRFLLRSVTCVVWSTQESRIKERDWHEIETAFWNRKDAEAKALFMEYMAKANAEMDKGEDWKP